MNKLDELATLLSVHNSLGEKISRLISRPATIGHTGEFIASEIFNIKLEESAIQKAIDGRFTSGPLAGKSVNVKWYGKLESILDMSIDDQPDYYLVMTGPKSTAENSKGGVRPWVIDYVFLFDSETLVQQQKSRGVKIGIGSSVRKRQWLEAEIYPNASNKSLPITSEQREMLKSFGSAK
jgi:hypothetical protein